MTETATNRVEPGQLRQYVEQLERLDAEKSDLAETRKEKVAEIKGAGYDVKVIAKILAHRKMDPNDKAEADALLEMYTEALA
jgi:uncharacterized protein (UPF0335 family)